MYTAYTDLITDDLPYQHTLLDIQNILEKHQYLNYIYEQGF